MKKSFNVVLCLVILLSIAVPVAATAETDKQLFVEPTIVGDKFVDPILVDTTYPGDVMPLDNYNEIPVVTDTITSYKTVSVTPTEQPPLGYKGGSGGIPFFFSEGGKSVDFTVTIEAKNVTFTAKTGIYSRNGAGYAAPVPAEKGNYRFQFVKEYVITTKKTDVYQYGLYKYSYMTHDPKYSLDHQWIKL